MKNRTLVVVIVFISGLVAGWIFFHSPSKKNGEKIEVHTKVNSAIWTCSMHPQIRMNEPGKCPICQMDLVPVSSISDRDNKDQDVVELSASAAALADIKTMVITRQNPVSEIHLYGKVVPDERLIQSQTAHVDGRIEELDLNFTGEPVKVGQRLAVIYSPEIITAQEELLVASGSKMLNPGIYDAAKEKLRLLKLSEDQIDNVEKTGTVQTRVNIYSNSSGIVVTRKVNAGDYISKGGVMYEIADLSKVWITFEAYENDISLIRTGGIITFKLRALPGSEFSGKVDFIDPFIDPVTRIIKIRTEAENKTGQLKPGLFVNGTMMTSDSQTKNSIIVPQSSVLWTGKRSLVYVKIKADGNLQFKMREVELGPRLGDNYIVNSGLSEGDEIVVNGTFSIDAVAQLEGKKSMMNQK
jgi:membrane fusion protein, copper/silver efflux system